MDISGRRIPGVTARCGGAIVKEEVLKEDL